VNGKSSAVRIVSVGALTWENGFPYALLAIRNLVDGTGAQVGYWIHGQGPGRTEVLFTIADLELEGHAQLMPEPLDLREALAGADVYLDTRVKPGPRAGLAAAAAVALPIVATDLGDGVAGTLVPPRDAHAAAAALARALGLGP
jgi:glycosyltransferase involved in cell wall biosynthesis